MLQNSVASFGKNIVYEYMYYKTYRGNALHKMHINVFAVVLFDKSETFPLPTAISAAYVIMICERLT